MSGIEKVLAKEACPPAGPYSQAIKAAGQIWVSGQIPADKEGTLIEGSITDKTRMCCQNVKAILEEAGSSIDKVVRVGVFLTDMKNFPEMNAEYEKWFSHKPSRSCVAVYQLPKGVPVCSLESHPVERVELICTIGRDRGYCSAIDCEWEVEVDK